MMFFNPPKKTDIFITSVERINGGKKERETIYKEKEAVGDRGYPLSVVLDRRLASFSLEIDSLSFSLYKFSLHFLTAEDVTAKCDEDFCFFVSKSKIPKQNISFHHYLPYEQ